MTLPEGDTVRVFARLGVEGLQAGQWGDLPRARAVTLLNLGYVALTDQAGVGAPEGFIPRVGCC